MSSIAGSTMMIAYSLCCSGRSPTTKYLLCKRSAGLGEIEIGPGGNLNKSTGKLAMMD
jgi:hypothetical protein